MPEISEIQSLTQEAQRLSESVSSWNGKIIGGLVLAAIAAVALVVIQFLAFRDSRLLSEVQDKLLKARDEKLVKELSEKDVLIANAREGAAKAEQKAAEANQKAEEERLARVKIEERLAPRSIKADQLNNLFEQIKSHTGVSIDILQYGESPEITNFAVLIGLPLQKAGWNPRRWIVVGDGPMVGISVGVRLDAGKAVEDAANALVAALVSEGIGTRRFTPYRKEWPGFVSGPPYDENKQSPIRMLIGTKP